MIASVLDSLALPVLVAEAAPGKVLGFAGNVATARELGAIWAAAHGQRVLGMVCSRRYRLDPTSNSEATWLRAKNARRAWLVLTDSAA